MGFFKSLFGIGNNSNQILSIHDDEFGNLTAIKNPGKKVIWRSSANFLGYPVEIYIPGDTEKLSQNEKVSIQEILKNQSPIETEINRSLKELYDNAGKTYQNWSQHFNLISITATATHPIITLEERDSFYEFTIFFTDSKATGVSIDS